MRTEKRRAQKHKWTPEQDAQLLELAEAECNYHRMGPIIGLPVHVIASRGRKLGLSMAKHRGGGSRNEEPLPKEVPALRALGKLNHADGTPVHYQLAYRGSM